jgi:hypothetical protein
MRERAAWRNMKRKGNKLPNFRLQNLRDFTVFPQHDDDVILLQLVGGAAPLSPE